MTNFLKWLKHIKHYHYFFLSEFRWKNNENNYIFDFQTDNKSRTYMTQTLTLNTYDAKLLKQFNKAYKNMVAKNDFHFYKCEKKTTDAAETCLKLLKKLEKKGISLKQEGHNIEEIKINRDGIWVYVITADKQRESRYFTIYGGFKYTQNAIHILDLVDLLENGEIYNN